MSSNLFTPKLRYTNKDTCNSAWTFIDGQNVSDIEVPQFIKNLFTSFDDSRYGKMGKDLIEGADGDAGGSCINNPGGDPTCNGNLSCINSVCINNVCDQSVCSGNNVLIDPLTTLDAGETATDQNCCVSPPSNICQLSVCSDNNVLKSPLPTLDAGVTATDQNCCESPTTTHTCSSAFQGATTGKEHPCNLNDPESADWTKGNLKEDPLWGKYDTGNDNSSLMAEQATAIEALITSNTGKQSSDKPGPMDKGVWGKCCKKAECTDEGWDNISITDTTGSWAAYGSSWGCILSSSDTSADP